VPAIRKPFAGFNLKPVQLTYSLPGSHKVQRAAELIITGR
jgi:hypothetical protein